MLPLSQSHLTLLDACERRYQYVFWEALSGPATYEQQVTTQWGSQFHLLMQQRALDLPVEAMAGASAEMSDSLAALVEAAPEVFEHLTATASGAACSRAGSAGDDMKFSQSEHRRQLAFNGYLLTVIYDLLVCSQSAVDSDSQTMAGSQGQIFDWKTHQRSPRKERLKNDWQTRLYLYVLCETTNLRPEQISMTYWFVRLSEEKQLGFYRFDYSEKQHQATHQDLLRLTNRLTQLLKLAASAVDFPKVAIEKGLCDHCPFNLRCDRVSLATPAAFSPAPDPYQLLQSASQFTADTVEEIPW